MNQQTRYKQIGNPLKKKIEWTVPRSRKRWTTTLNYKEMTTRGGEAVCLCHLMLRGANPRPTSRWLGHVSWAGAQVSSPRFHLLFLQNIGEVYWLINNEKTIISSYFFIFKKLSPNVYFSGIWSKRLWMREDSSLAKSPMPWRLMLSLCKMMTHSMLNHKR
jgi:hypothetical protein